MLHDHVHVRQYYGRSNGAGRIMSRLSELPGNAIKSVWPYWMGALLLALLNIGLFLARGVPWGITQAFSYWGGKVGSFYSGF